LSRTIRCVWQSWRVPRVLIPFQRLQDQDKRNHEAYIRSGDIFEDRQQSYERMTKTFERMHELGKRWVRRAAE